MSADIPPHVRAQVRTRDGSRCRMCGRTDRPVSIHHVVFGGDARGMGGQRVHNPDELVCLDEACHVRAHSDKRVWQPLLLDVIRRPGLTAMQLRRWNARSLEGMSTT